MLKKFTTNESLFEVLEKLMSLESLSDFRLVGGTALSLLLGHRISEDIDMFAFKTYGSISFKIIEEEISATFPIVINTDENIPGLKNLENNFGLHLFIGKDNNSIVKVDILNWSDDFIFPVVLEDKIRLTLTDVAEIAAMKLDVISRGGRKKDFWDLSEILETHSLQSLIEVYKRKYPYNDIGLVLTGLLNFSVADNMPDPVCFRGKYWELIQQEIKQKVRELLNNNTGG